MPADRPIVFTGTLILPDRLLENGAVVCRGERITAVGPKSEVEMPRDAEIVDVADGLIGPGYVDIHVHGGDGADYMDGTPEAVTTANRCHARHGTTSIFPTTTTGSREQITAMLHACQSVQASWEIKSGARVAGVHFYGPYFAEDKVGCHLVSGRRDPDPEEYREHLALGIIRVATCAAELPGAELFYREASRRGCFVTCGHSNANWAEMDRAFRAGMRHVDHFWCAMSSVPSIRTRFGTPSQGSMEQFVLMHAEMSTEVIADSCHLAPELLEFAFVMKSAKRLCLVTDANRAVDMPPGKYRFGPQADGEWFKSDGRVGSVEGGALASSVVGMDTMVRNMSKLTSAGIVNAVRMGSLTPAERVGVDKDVGSLKVAKRADLLLLDREMHVQRVFIGGMEFATSRRRNLE
jgi:N-acetylglucosamine-6-phosphate deacetylase